VHAVTSSEYAQDYAWDYALALLSGCEVNQANALSQFDFEHPAIGWQRSGLMALTGTSSGASLMSPAPMTACADGALAALQLLVNTHNPSFQFNFRGATLLGERAQLMELRRAGATSPGGACRLLATADGLLAVSLPRDDDWALVPAWLEAPVDDWSVLSETLAQRESDELIKRARTLGLAVCQADLLPEEAKASCAQLDDFSHPIRKRQKTPLVLDLSSLWAGPLSASLLAISGARVIKVESSHRADGARLGHAGFYQLLNSAKESVVLDLTTTAGRTELKALIQLADIVIESARPRALEQMGIYATACIESNPGLVWASITAYGRTGADESCTSGDALGIGFGDDVAAGAGLPAQLRQAHDLNVFCGDAIADPITGIHAAFYAYRQWCTGIGALLDIPMLAITRKCANFAATEDLRGRVQKWHAIAIANSASNYPLRSNDTELVSGVDDLIHQA